MTEMEIMDFLEASWRLLFAQAGSTVSLQTRATNLRPEIIGNQAGFSFEMAWNSDATPGFRSLVFCVVKNGRLHVALYQGTGIGFYDRHLADARAVMESLHTLAGPPPPTTG
ncbi:MAG: hypothetical protein FD153_1321 [Rhodospirillaceae bacterium]|nr:MAG: hypothetical protein FD153_1321 [Rhodospirillaceae bacterium]